MVSKSGLQGRKQEQRVKVRIFFLTQCVDQSHPFWLRAPALNEPKSGWGWKLLWIFPGLPVPQRPIGNKEDFLDQFPLQPILLPSTRSHPWSWGPYLLRHLGQTQGCFNVAVYIMPSQGPLNYKLVQQLDQVHLLWCTLHYGQPGKVLQLSLRIHAGMLPGPPVDTKMRGCSNRSVGLLHPWFHICVGLKQPQIL